MTMTQMLEEDREEFLGRLKSARTSDKMTAVLESEIDRILYRYNEDCEREGERQAAAWILQSVKVAAGWVNTESRVNVWEQAFSGEGKRTKRPVWFYVCLAAGVIFLLLSVFTSGPENLSSLGAALGLVFLGGASLVVAGWLWRGGDAGKGRSSLQTNGKDRMFEILPDEAGVYRILHTVLLIADQNLGKAGDIWKQIQTEEDASAGANGVPGDLLKVIGSLLEAEYSEDGEYALEKIADLRYFLHRHDIEVADRNEENAWCFDEIPSAEKGTLRPALLYEGRVLVKGLYGA